MANVPRMATGTSGGLKPVLSHSHTQTKKTVEDASMPPTFSSVTHFSRRTSVSLRSMNEGSTFEFERFVSRRIENASSGARLRGSDPGIDGQRSVSTAHTSTVLMRCHRKCHEENGGSSGML